MKNSTIQNCSCRYFIFLNSQTFQMHIKTASITVQNNEQTFAYIQNGYYTDIGSTFQQNTATSTDTSAASVFSGNSGTQAIFTNTTFKNNSVLYKGGTIVISLQGTRAEFYNIKATGNQSMTGGFLSVHNDATFYIYNSIISNNSAKRGSAI